MCTNHQQMNACCCKVLAISILIMSSFLVRMDSLLVKKSSYMRVGIGVVLAPSFSKHVWELTYFINLQGQNTNARKIMRFFLSTLVMACKHTFCQTLWKQNCLHKEVELPRQCIGLTQMIVHHVWSLYYYSLGYELHFQRILGMLIPKCAPKVLTCNLPIHLRTNISQDLCPSQS